jgi:2-isopropylmalate synthase
MKTFEVLDTTLRDGAQAEGVSFSVSDKLTILRALDDFGVKYIEAGNPGSNPKDMAFFAAAKELSLKHATLVAFGSTARIGVAPQEDANVKSLLEADTKAVAIFGKSWDLHVREILKATLEDNLACVYDTVRHLKACGREVIFDAEHFFDGYEHNQAYALAVLDAAARGGADVLCLCDTNGGTAPMRVFDITKRLCALYPNTRIGIHCHDDIGCAVANSLLAVDAGAVHIQGTFNGIGERCGNADLSSIIPNLVLKGGYTCANGRMDTLRNTAVTIAEVTNLSLSNAKPYVGDSAFAHKGGMHIDGVDKLARSFEHIDPAAVGNSRRYLLSEVAGRKAVLLKIADIAPDLQKDDDGIAQILANLKSLEHDGFQFEAADASFTLMVLRTLSRFSPHFRLQMYRTSGEFPPPDGEMSASAIIKIEVGGQSETTAAIGNGPVHALDLALRKALCVFYPALLGVYLVDFKVRVLESGSATGSRVRVLIESTDGHNRWTTVGASTDIIEASFLALVDSLEYKLWMEEQPWA